MLLASPHRPDRGGGQIRAHLELDAEVASARHARRFVADLLAPWRPDPDDVVVDAATLLVSELVANAVLHARSSVHLVVATTPVLRIEVHDRSAHRPDLNPADPDATSGRGLALVDALSDRWGVETGGRGKRVWFELWSWL